MVDWILGGLSALNVRYPFGATTIFVIVWLVLGFLLWYGITAYPPSKGTAGTGGTSQQQVVQSSPGAVIVQLQAARDIILSPSISVRVESPTLPSGGDGSFVENGSFENRLEGWGTGWVEDNNESLALRTRYLLSGNAQATWYADSSEQKSGEASLRVEHSSLPGPHVWSTLSQRIRLKRQTDYEVSFWVKSQQIDPKGGLSLIIAFARDWTRKVPVDAGTYNWRLFTGRFKSGDRVDVDLRFLAEGPAKTWIDDVSIREIPRALSKTNP